MEASLRSVFSKFWKKSMKSLLQDFRKTSNNDYKENISAVHLNLSAKVAESIVDAPFISL
jgi:hypothetical protein